jgi:hypothetical protein
MAEPTTSSCAPARTAPGAVAAEMPPVDLDEGGQPGPLDEAAGLGGLGLHGLEVGLATEAVVHGHDQEHVDLVEDVADALQRRGPD